MSPQNKKVLAYLERHGSIDTVQGAKELFILRLSQRIIELREAGYEIRSARAEGKSYQRYTFLGRRAYPAVYRADYLIEQRKEATKLI